MVVVAQLVRAPGCGPGGRRFKSGLPPHFTARGRAVAARQAHNLKVNGSIPFPATIERLCRSCDRLFCMLSLCAVSATFLFREWAFFIFKSSHTILESIKNY